MSTTLATAEMASDRPSWCRLGNLKQRPRVVGSPNTPVCLALKHCPGDGTTSSAETGNVPGKSGHIIHPRGGWVCKDRASAACSPRPTWREAVRYSQEGGAQRPSHLFSVLGLRSTQLASWHPTLWDPKRSPCWSSDCPGCCPPCHSYG